MSKKIAGIALFPFLLSLLVLFSACGATKVGTIPSGTPDHGSGTSAVLATTTSSAQNVSSAPAGTLGSAYAFVRKDQLWVALHSAKPAQVTNFDYSNSPTVFWHQPLWSSDDAYIALITTAGPTGLGGGGCPAPDYGANGALYVMNTKTQQFTQMALPAVSKDVQMSGAPRMDSWQYAFWEDTTHLLAWYNSGPGKTGTGLYRYDINTQTLSQVLSVHALGAATLFDPQKGLPLLLSLRYSSEQLFYQVVVHPFEQQSQIVLYSHSLTHPETQSKQLLQMGSEPWCATPQGGAFVKPGWDVAPDGQQLVAQMITATGSSQAVGTVQALNLNDHSTTGLFAQVPTDVLSQDIALTWGPDSQTVVATAYHMLAQSSPYTASLANPTAVQQYAPNLVGQVTWRTDSTAFVLQSTEALDTTTAPDVYVFLLGDTHGQMLLADAHDFTWG
ncbi:MAG: hypothetical protein NVS4B11_06600 [Ktedonobacteraceae bacterium]